MLHAGQVGGVNCSPAMSLSNCRSLRYVTGALKLSLPGDRYRARLSCDAHNGKHGKHSLGLFARALPRWTEGENPHFVRSVSPAQAQGVVQLLGNNKVSSERSWPQS